MNILWCITGAGEFLKESIEVISKLEGDKITIFVSRAGEEVLRNYKLFRELKKNWEIVVDDNNSAIKAGKVTLGSYDKVVVSPATANTVAKVANGIADNLVTTAVSLALKTGVKVYMIPTDWAGGNVKIPDTITPGGSIIHMKPRKSDLRNIKYLEQEKIEVLDKPERLLKELK